MPDLKPVLAVLDDEPKLRTALRRVLAGCDFSVEEYAHGNDLLVAIGSRRLDCLLLDLNMPGVSGFEVLAALQARAIHTPVIVITARDEPGTAERVRSLGAVACLQKPVDRDTLLSAICAALQAGPERVPD